MKITIHCRPEQSLLEMASQLRGLGYELRYLADGIHAISNETAATTPSNVVPLRKPVRNPFLGGAA